MRLMLFLGKQVSQCHSFLEELRPNDWSGPAEGRNRRSLADTLCNDTAGDP